MTSWLSGKTTGDAAQVFENVACPFCGILCDDLEITRTGGSLKVLKNGCDKAIAGFERQVAGAKPQVAGRDVTLDEAVKAATDLVKAARLPMYGGLGTDVDGIRAVMALAEKSGGIVDHALSEGQYRNFRVLQSTGWFMSTLTEVRNRADLIIVVGSDLHKLHPRFFERIVNANVSMISDAPPKRTVVFLGKGLDTSGVAGSRIGDVITLPCPLDQVSDVVSALRALLKGAPLHTDEIAGVKVSQIQDLADRCRKASYSVFVWAPPSLAFPHAELTVQLVSELVKEINLTSRSACLSLGGNEGAVTAGAVCSWQSGYPLRVSFQTGKPDYDPLRHSINRMLGGRRRRSPAVDFLVHAGPRTTRHQGADDRARHAGRENGDSPRRLYPDRHAGRRPRGPYRALRQRRDAAAAATCIARRCPNSPTSSPRSNSPFSPQVQRRMLIKFTGGRVYDPMNGVNGEVRDIYARDGRIVAAPGRAEKIDQEYALNGTIVMAGAIDPHSHIGGGKVTIGRMLMPEDHLGKEVARTDLTRAGCGHAVPSTMTTGYRYAEMGYTAAFEPAMLPANARQAHLEMGDTPIIDKGAFVMLGNDDFFLRSLVEKKSFSFIKDYIGWTMHASQALAVKVVNPGGISAFKFNQRKLDLDEKHAHYGVTPRDIIVNLARGLKELGVVHPIHIHGCNLGVPGNDETTLATIRAAEGPADPPDPHSVLLLRHRGRQEVLVQRRADRRTRQQAQERIHRRRPDPVWPDVHGLRRQHAPVRQHEVRQPQQVGGHGHRMRQRLRCRADEVSRQVVRERAAVGHRPRAVPHGR